MGSFTYRFHCIAPLPLGLAVELVRLYTSGSPFSLLNLLSFFNCKDGRTPYEWEWTPIFYVSQLRSFTVESMKSSSWESHCLVESWTVNKGTRCNSFSYSFTVKYQYSRFILFSWTFLNSVMQKSRRNRKRASYWTWKCFKERLKQQERWIRLNSLYLFYSSRKKAGRGKTPDSFSFPFFQLFIQEVKWLRSLLILYSLIVSYYKERKWLWTGSQDKEKWKKDQLLHLNLFLLSLGQAICWRTFLYRRVSKFIVFIRSNFRAA